MYKIFYRSYYLGYIAARSPELALKQWGIPAGDNPADYRAEYAPALTPAGVL